MHRYFTFTIHKTVHLLGDRGRESEQTNPTSGLAGLETEPQIELSAVTQAVADTYFCTVHPLHSSSGAEWATDSELRTAKYVRESSGALWTATLCAVELLQAYSPGLLSFLLTEVAVCDTLSNPSVS